MFLPFTYDEHIQRLQVICDEKCVQFEMYDNEVESIKRKGVKAPKDLEDKLVLAENELREAVFNYHSLVSFCHNKNIDLTKHFKRLGIKQILTHIL